MMSAVSSSNSARGILVVGKVPEDRKRLRHSLSGGDLQLEFHECDTLVAALEFCRLHKGALAAGILDVSFNRETDQEILRKLLDRSNLGPCLLLTGAHDSQTIIAALEAGIEEYIEKDARDHWLQHLPYTVKNLLRRHDEMETGRKAIEALSNLGDSRSDGMRQGNLLAEVVLRINLTLAFDCAMVGRFSTANSRSFKAQAVACGERIQPAVKLNLPEAPVQALRDGKDWIVNDNLAELHADLIFPSATDSRSLLACPLRDHEGRVNGLLLGLKRQPLSPDQAAGILSVLRAFATLAELELERSRVSDALRAESQAIDHVREAVLHLDMKGNLKGWNLYAEKLLQFEDNSLLGKPFAAFLTGFSTEEFTVSVIQPLLLNGVHYMDLRVEALSGYSFEAHLFFTLEKGAAGAAEGIIVHCTDVTDQKLAFRQNHEARQRLAFHFQKTPLGCVEWDLQSRVRAWNPAAEQIFGYKAEEIIGKSFAELVHPDLHESISGIFDKLRQLDGGKTSTNENLTKDGRLITCEWYNTPLVNEQGIVVGFASLVRDITHRIQRERELAQAKEAADEANRSKDNFLAVMSHEIRTPMNSIVGFTDLLLDTPLDAGQRDNLEIIKANAYQLLGIIDNVLEYSRLDSGKVSPDLTELELSLLLHEISDAMQAEANQKGLLLDLSVAAGLPGVFLAALPELRRILLNLVGNAIKFTAQGKVDFHVSGKPVKDRGGFWDVTFSVRDTGIGIEPEHLEMLFSGFTQLDSSSTRKFGGAGLGLAICRKLADLLGGEISAASEAGKGSVFKLNLELEAMDAEPLAVTGDQGELAAGDAQPEAGNSLEIMVVSGRREQSQLLTESFAQLGFDRCSLVLSGLDAVEMMHARTFPLVIVDSELPDMSALEFASYIRSGQAGEEHAKCTLWLLESGSAEQLSRKCVNAGYDSLCKPTFVRPKLRTLLHRAHSHWQKVLGRAG